MALRLDRREFLMVAGATAVTTSLSTPLKIRAKMSPKEPQGAKPELANVKACVFDTFGTVVDWRSSVIAEATGWGKAKRLNVNWVEFTDRWRLGYRPAIDKVRSGRNAITLRRLNMLEEGLKELYVEELKDLYSAENQTPSRFLLMMASSEQGAFPVWKSGASHVPILQPRDATLSNSPIFSLP